jgi:SAM-dependent methyltransferase
MDQLYELETHEVEERHWWYRGRREVIAEALARLDLPPAPEILDAGCGSGRNMVELARVGAVTGVELADASAQRARQRNVGSVVQGSVTDLPFEDDSFDLAVCLDVIEHLDDDRAALRELRRVIRPGGKLLVTVPAYQWLWSEHDEVNHHRRRYTKRTLLTAVSDSGWDVESTTYFNSLLLPLAIAYRSLSRVLRSRDEPASDLGRTPGRLNSLLERPLHWEARVIAHGRRIPAGLSLLAVLR